MRVSSPLRSDPPGLVKRNTVPSPEPGSQSVGQDTISLKSSNAPVRFGNTVEASSPSDNRLAEMRLYLEKTGFPNTELTSTRIENHAIDAMRKAAQDTGCTLYYSGYDPHCSIATGKALPGSDLDDWVILIEPPKSGPTPGFLKRMYNDFMEWLTPPEVDPSPKEVFLKALEGHLDPEWIDKHHDVLPEILLVPEVEAECREFISKKKGETVSDNYDTVRALFRTIGNGKALIDEIPAKQRKRLDKAALYRQESKRVPYDVTVTWPEKLKHRTRETLAKAFPTLTPAEQLMVTQILKTSFHSAQNPDFMLLSSGENRPVLESLEEKGLLVRLDPTSETFLARKTEIAKKQDWQMQIYIEDFLKFPKMVAPWKPYYGDEVILTELLDPELARRQDQLVEACGGNPDLLPKGLRHRLTQKLDPDKDALVQRMLYGKRLKKKPRKT